MLEGACWAADGVLPPGLEVVLDDVPGDVVPPRLEKILIGEFGLLVRDPLPAVDGPAAVDPDAGFDAVVIANVLLVLLLL